MHRSGTKLEIMQNFNIDKKKLFSDVVPSGSFYRKLHYSNSNCKMLLHFVADVKDAYTKRQKVWIRSKKRALNIFWMIANIQFWFLLRFLVKGTNKIQGTVQEIKEAVKFKRTYTCWLQWNDDGIHRIKKINATKQVLANGNIDTSYLIKPKQICTSVTSWMERKRRK